MRIARFASPHGPHEAACGCRTATSSSCAISSPRQRGCRDLLVTPREIGGLPFGDLVRLMTTSSTVPDDGSLLLATQSISVPSTRVMFRPMLHATARAAMKGGAPVDCGAAAIHRFGDGGQAPKKSTCRLRECCVAPYRLSTACLAAGIDSCVSRWTKKKQKGSVMIASVFPSGLEGMFLSGTPFERVNRAGCQADWTAPWGRSPEPDGRPGALAIASMATGSWMKFLRKAKNGWTASTRAKLNGSGEHPCRRGREPPMTRWVDGVRREPDTDKTDRAIHRKAAEHRRPEGNRYRECLRCVEGHGFALVQRPQDPAPEDTADHLGPVLRGHAAGRVLLPGGSASLALRCTPPARWRTGDRPDSQ